MTCAAGVLVVVLASAGAASAARLAGSGPQLAAAGVQLAGRTGQPASGRPQVASSAITFSHAVVVDHQRVAGEPSLSISPTVNKLGHHDLYVSAPYGFSTTASFVWKSEDGGQTFHLVAGQEPPLGKPNTCVGGGDSSIVNDTAGNLYFADLQGLTDVSTAVSTDGGRTFTFTCNAANTTAVDRPWLSVYGDPLTTGREYMAVDDVEQCIANCSSNSGQIGSNVVELTHTSGSAAAEQVFSPTVPQQIEADGIVSGTVVDQRTGDVYIVHTGYTNSKGSIRGGSDANGNDNAVVVDRFPGGDSATVTGTLSNAMSVCAPYNTSSPPCDSYTAFHAPRVTYKGSKYSSVTVGQDFSPIAIDSAGGLYVVWSQAPTDPATGLITGPSTIYLAYSTDKGATWSAPIDVSASVPGLQTNVFPWVAAGAPGKVDVVWYGTPTLGTCPSKSASTPTCGSSSIAGVWNVYLAQSLNLTSAHPTFQATKVSEYSNHYGAICTMGIGCSTGGDRGLLDFIQVQTGPQGQAEVVWSDAANDNFNGGTSSALIDYARQVSGPGLYGSNVTGPVPATGTAAGSPAAYYAAAGSQTPAPGNLKIVSSSVYGPTSAGDYVVKMVVQNLSSLAVPANLGGPDAVWLTRFELPVAKPTLQVQGHIYFAAMESDGGGSPSFYAGQTGAISSSHAKFLTYPPGETVTGSYTAGAPGTITITVPAQDLGSPASGSALRSITGLTATQALPASSGNAIFNLIDATAPYDGVLSAKLLAAHPSTTTVSARTTGHASSAAQQATTASGRLPMTGLNPLLPEVGAAFLLVAGWLAFIRRRRLARTR
ncbi:MAG: hypothetical protein ACYCO3_10335 [Mycobacteriales bacterium]